MSLEIENLSFADLGRTILNGMSMTFPLGGRITGLLGPNGAGKSTLFRCIMGFERGYRGEIRFAGQSLNALSPSARSRRGIGYLPQESWLFQDLNVEENLLLVGELMDKRGAALAEEVQAAIREMGLGAARGTRGEHLSGGERRRLEFARTLMMKPKILLLDEPFSGIDPKTVQEITHIVLGLKARGIATVLSDHYAQQILDLSDRAYVLAGGALIAAGAPEDVRRDPRVREIYLGTI